MVMDPYRVRPRKKFDLGHYDASDTSGFEGGKSRGLRELEKLKPRLERLQELLYAEHRRSLLIVLQAMDAGGKDGTIRAVFAGVNPQGVRVAQFKVPTPEESSHDFLWRVHVKAPAKGEIVIFNRSHYEDVIVPRVHQTIRPSAWERRYREINEFERTLSAEGTTILKFFLHIDSDEQKRRLNARLEDPEKRWKFNEFDLRERKFWAEYMRAYGEAIRKTTTPWAPWHVVPSNRKWFRDLVVCQVISDTLEGMRLRFPVVSAPLKSL